MDGPIPTAASAQIFARTARHIATMKAKTQANRNAVRETREAIQASLALIRNILDREAGP